MCENISAKIQHKVSGMLWFHCSLWSVPFRKLGNTSVSFLGDCLSIAVIQHRPKNTLEKMDEQCHEESGYSERM